MKINDRLKTVADFILKDTNVIDVGCDHALLSIFLAKNYPNMRVIASDLRQGPYQRAKENIEKHGLSDRIVLKLGYGISTMDRRTNAIIISGMGGKTITEIIKEDRNKLNQIEQIVVSPNNDPYVVRSEITKLGFIIDREEVVKEKDKFYLVISFVKGQERYRRRELYFGTKKILYNQDCKGYYREQFLLLFNKYSRLPDKKIISKYLVKIKIDMLADVVDALDKIVAKEVKKRQSQERKELRKKHRQEMKKLKTTQLIERRKKKIK